MTTFITVLVILAFIAVIRFLPNAKEKHLKFSTRVFQHWAWGLF